MVMRKVKPLTQEMVDGVKAGMTPSEVATALGCTYSQVVSAVWRDEQRRKRSAQESNRRSYLRKKAHAGGLTADETEEYVKLDRSLKKRRRVKYPVEVTQVKQDVVVEIKPMPPMQSVQSVQPLVNDEEWDLLRNVANEVEPTQHVHKRSVWQRIKAVFTGD